MDGRFFDCNQTVDSRDRLVVRACAALRLPVAWNLAGGYQSPLRRVLDIHDATLRACAAVYLAPADRT